MTSLIEVSTHWPTQVSIADRQRALGLTDTELRRYGRGFGLSEVCWDETESETESLLAAVGKLTALRGREDKVRYVLRPRTQRFLSPYPLSPLHEVRREAGLRHAKTFALTEQACASGLVAVDVAGMLLAEDPDPEALALVLVGEKAYTQVAQVLAGMGITGEGTAAVLVSAAATRDRVLGFATRTVSVGDPNLVMTDEGFATFRDIYPDMLMGVIDEALADAGLTTADLALVLPHNVNRIAWVRFSDRLGVEVDRIFLDNIPQTGHCFGADPFINYASAQALGRLRPGDRYLMVSVGVGASFAAMVVEH
ncbi:3-oxoacyl-[acyl-carrier-protein] synthase III C-terminal domain-containing protein [Kitasatospora fiedleri]|uniref:3-oxoacyl-[acyl-carrier-protein] synthase III C-terminal domain-containing protein n=1 Tax=Kitasatospora fiedleri TaxID=2991545 RepID=UPI00249BDD4F|nr:3-oxoacyl-[acyl-carrier-protein] synthase III C-terminal domain-containing protein [Kitasatospora fiedleri]